MYRQKSTAYVGIGTILLALMLRLVAAGLAPTPEKPREPALFQPEPTVQATLPPPETQPIPTTEPTLPPSLQIGPEDGSVVLSDQAGYGPDVQALLSAPLRWQLRAPEPTVLILHTHGTESYTKQPDQSYTEKSPYRTADADYNMLSVGQELARVLEEGGVGVIHDRMLHDYASYADSYASARKSIEAHLAAYPSVCMVIDLHRDALDFNAEPQLKTEAQVDGQLSSQLMLVAGTDKNASHPDWQENLSLGLKLTAVLEKAYPGITRPIQLRPQRFNLDLSPGSLLVEVGANGDTHDQALVAVRALGEAILTLADGANLQNGPPV